MNRTIVRRKSYQSVLFVLFCLTDGAVPINMSDTYLPPHIQYQLFPGALRGIWSISINSCMNNSLNQIPGQAGVVLVCTCCSIFTAKSQVISYIVLTFSETDSWTVLSFSFGGKFFEQMVSFVQLYPYAISKL